jgi:hypothetical protein
LARFFNAVLNVRESGLLWSNIWTFRFSRITPPNTSDVTRRKAPRDNVRRIEGSIIAAVGIENREIGAAYRRVNDDLAVLVAVLVNLDCSSDEEIGRLGRIRLWRDAWREGRRNSSNVANRSGGECIF